MNKKFKLTLPHILLILSVIGIGLSFYFPNFSYLQSGILITFIILYVSLSLLHHYLDKSLTIEITLEYILIAALVLVLFTRVLA